MIMLTSKYNPCSENSSRSMNAGDNLQVLSCDSAMSSPWLGTDWVTRGAVRAGLGLVTCDWHCGPWLTCDAIPWHEMWDGSHPRGGNMGTGGGQPMWSVLQTPGHCSDLQDWPGRCTQHCSMVCRERWISGKNEKSRISLRMRKWYKMYIPFEQKAWRWA